MTLSLARDPSFPHRDALLDPAFVAACLARRFDWATRVTRFERVRVTYRIGHSLRILYRFEAGGTEYRLGALRHTVADYLDVIDESGFGDINIREFRGDELLVRDIPWASKYLGRPLLLTVEAYKT